MPIVVVDQDRSVESRELISRFDASQSFVIVAVEQAVQAIDADLDAGRAWMALTVPAGYGEKVATGVPVAVQVVADGTDANSTNVALGYATALVGAYSRELSAAAGRTPLDPLVSADVRCGSTRSSRAATS